MKHRSSWLVPVLAVCGLLSVGADRAFAQVVNGNFETGTLSGFGVVTGSTAGVTTTPGGSFAGYSNGTNQAILTAGIAPFGTIATQLTAGNSLGYTFTTTNFTNLTQSTGSTQDGSVIFQQFTGSGPLTFIFGFDNQEGVGSGFHDVLFTFVDGTFTVLRDANNNPTDTAYSTFTSPSLPSGSHFVVVGVLNGGDNAVSSRGIFDNFSISGASVPEPTTVVLLAGVALGAVAYRPIKRRIKKHLRSAHA